MIPFSSIYLILIAISFGIIIYNFLRFRKISNVMFLVAAVPLILIFIFEPYQAKHGGTTIGGFFEQINDYETHYLVKVQIPDENTPDHPSSQATLLRLKSPCSVLTASYFPKKCQRVTLLESIYAPGIMAQIDKINFEPNYCILEKFNTETLCIDDHSRSWNVTLLNEKSE